MTSQFAKFFLTFYIDGATKPPGKEGAVDTKTTCKIDQRIAFDQRGLVSGGGFGGTLLHGQVLGVTHICHTGPSGQLRFGCLSAGNLSNGHGHVDLRVFLSLQGQGADIVAGMFADKAEGFGGDLHDSKFIVRQR